MLKEGDVIEAVCSELQQLGYAIEQKLTTKQQGEDIVAVRLEEPKQLLFIEAKGETSSRIGSKRYGRPFSSAQVRVHVAEGLYKIAEILTRSRVANNVKVGMALPDTPLHRKFGNAINATMTELDIAVFWVRQDKSVEIESPWEV